MTDQDLTSRALAAWYRAGNTVAPGKASGMVEIDGKRYVRLVNASGLLAVYRVRIVPSGPMLKRLKRWPRELEEIAGRQGAGTPSRP